MYVSAKSNVKNKIYNVGSGKTISINHIVNLLGCNSINIPKRPGEPDITFASIKQIKTDLSWDPEVSIEDGILLLLDNIEYWRNAPLWTPASISEATKDWFRYLNPQ